MAAILLATEVTEESESSLDEALEIATRGGAEVLGRDDCGQLAVGKRADIAIWDALAVENAGSWDPAALVLAGPAKVDALFVDGRQVVAEGQMVTIDLPSVISRQNALAQSLAEG